jgi:uncharacterized protein
MAYATTARPMSALDWIAMVLLIVGGLNWGLVGLFQFDLVAAIFGEMSLLSRIVYIAVGLSALWSLYTAAKLSRTTANAGAVPRTRAAYSGPERRKVDAPYAGPDRRMAMY